MNFGFNFAEENM